MQALRYLLAALIAVLFAGACGADHVWTEQKIRDYFGYGCSIAVDRFGLPHVAAPGNGGTLYAEQNLDGIWSTTALAPGVPSELTSIAVSPDGEPHILLSYNGGWVEDPIYFSLYATRTDAGWTIEELDQNPAVIRRTSMQIDALGRPVAAYLPYTSSAIARLATRVDGQWSYEDIAPQLNDVRDLAFALDHSGMPHLLCAYYDSKAPSATRRVAEYVTRGPNGWVVQELERGDRWGNPYVGSYPSIATDATGNPQITYSGPSYNRYAYRDASGWHIEPFTVPMGAAQIVADANRLMIAYPGLGRPPSAEGLWVAERKNGAWVHEFVSDDIENYCVIALGPHGTVHLAYMDHNYPTDPLTYVLGRTIEDVASPTGLLNPGFNWFSIPMAPLASSEASQTLGFDAVNRLFAWDAEAKNFSLYPDDFQDIAAGRGYVLYLKDPQSIAYCGVYPGANVELPRRGITWIGIPGTEDVPQEKIVIENRKTGELRTVAEDTTAPDPWLNPNWVYYDSLSQTAKILNWSGGSDDTMTHPWLMYRVWSNEEYCRLIVP